MFDIPTFFRLFIKYPLHDIKEKYRGGIKIDREKKKMMRFGKDTSIILIGEEKKEFEEVSNRTNYILNKNYNIKVNKRKKKLMVCSKDIQEQSLDITLDT